MMSGANASPAGRSHLETSGANASPAGRSHYAKYEKQSGWKCRHVWIAVLILVLFQISYAATSADPADKPMHRLLNAGRQAFNSGNYKQAEDYCRKAVAVAGATGASDSEVALVEGDLANVLLTEGQNDESEKLLNHAIETLKSNSRADQRELPILMGNLGKLYQQTGRLESAEKTLREAVRLGRQLISDEPLYLSDLYNNLGVLHLQTGNREQAERNFRKALALVEGVVHENDPRKAPILANISALYFMQHKWGLAERTLLISIDIVERARGASHPDLCALLDNLGIIYFRQNDLVKAEEALRRELAIRRTAFGPQNVLTASAAASLANVLAATGKYDEAGNLFSEALNTQERVLGQRVPEVATTLEQFATLLRRTNREALAGDMESRAESIRMELLYTVSVKELRNR